MAHRCRQSSTNGPSVLLRLAAVHWLSPDRDVGAAVGGEGLAVPASPAVAQPEAGELGHQIELGGPRVAERDCPVFAGSAVELHVMAAVLLAGVVEGVGDDPAGACPVAQDVLPGRQITQVRDAGLDDEAATGG